MKNILVATWAEALKVRRSKVFLITILTFIFVPLMMGILMFVAKNPELAQQFGILGAKATILNVKADWPTYLGLLNLAISGLGLIGFGFVASWVFGREYSDHTVKDLVALPTPRSSIVSSKLIVITIWSLLLALILFVFGLTAGAIVQLPGWSSTLGWQSAYAFVIISLLTLLLCTPVTFFASFGHGYLAPMGFIILALGVGQFINPLGLAPYFPWAVPMLYATALGSGGSPLGMISYIILFLASLAGLIGTFAWWRYADQR